MLAKTGACVRSASLFDFIAGMFVAWPSTMVKRDGTRTRKTIAAERAAGGVGMAAAVRMLPLELREALLIVVLAGLTHREAASALDISLATLIARLTKARERIAALTRAPIVAETAGAIARSVPHLASCQVMEAWRLADLHAYVDDCLEPDERLAFEKQMAEDPALARRAAMWRAQNSAIRSAFDGEGARAFSISIVRHQNEIPGKGRRPASVGARPSSRAAGAVAICRSAMTPRGLPRSRRAGRFSNPCHFGGLGSPRCSSALSAFGPRPRPSSPAKGLGEAGVAAFRAFVRPGVAPVEFATSDRAELQEWLTTRLLRPVYLPATPSRRQPGRSADRSLSRRGGGLSRLQVAAGTRRLAGPVP